MEELPFLHFALPVNIPWLLVCQDDKVQKVLLEGCSKESLVKVRKGWFQTGGRPQ